MSRFFRTVLLINAAFFLHFTSDASNSPKYIFKIATLAPERSVWIDTYNDIAVEIANATNGDVKFKCYPGGIQGDESTVLRKIRIGQLQGAGFTGSGLSQICRSALVFQLPILFQSKDEIDYVFAKMDDSLKSECQENGYYVLGWPTIGFSYLFGKYPVTNLASLRDSKPWLIDTDIIGKTMYEVANVQAVPGPVSDVLTGLRSGLINAVFSPPSAMISLQWFTAVNYRLDAKISHSFGAFVVVEKKWNKLPESYRNSIRAICDRKFARLNALVEQQNREALEVLEKQNIRTVALSHKGKAELITVSETVADTLAGTAFSQQSLIKLRDYLAEFRRDNSE